MRWMPFDSVPRSKITNKDDPEPCVVQGRFTYSGDMADQRMLIIAEPNQTVQLFWNEAHGEDRVLIRLVEEGASVDVLGFLTLAGNTQRELAIRVVHEAPKTESNVVLRGLLSDQARVSVTEVAEMIPGTPGSKTHVEAKALLLSEDASADLRPELEIAEDDVAATHAAHVGPLEDEELFYLMSRGISRKEAEQLLIQAFLAPVKHIAPDTIER